MLFAVPRSCAVVILFAGLVAGYTKIAMALLGSRPLPSARGWTNPSHSKKTGEGDGWEASRGYAPIDSKTELEEEALGMPVDDLNSLTAPAKDLFVPIFAISSILGFFSLYAWETVKIGCLFTPFGTFGCSCD